MKLDGQKEMKEFLLRIKNGVDQAEDEAVRESSPKFIDSKKKTNKVIIELEINNEDAKIKASN